MRINFEKERFIIKRVGEIGISIEAYKFDNNKYPSSLVKLQPDYMDTVPIIDLLIYTSDKTFQNYQLVYKGIDEKINSDIIKNLIVKGND